MKTYSVKPSEVNRAWYILDASKAPLGRVATQVATLLTGKGKPMFSHHIDCGDFVIVINTKDLIVTGDKLEKKIYYRHSGYPGGIKSTQLKDMNTNEVLIKAIRGMLPVNKLRDGRLMRLKVYSDDKHNHEAQKPTAVEVKEGK